MTQISAGLHDLVCSYRKSTPDRVKIIDAFLVFLMFSATSQLLYCCIAGSFPFNSFLSGFFSSAGTWTLTAALRTQMTRSDLFGGISAERAFAEYLVCNLVLHVLCINFLG
eukprot:gnl/MRDRNA2_/MRDRNA2_94456_c0_seq1.p1 gnl/MRDRNA2_/MRDRNA2_94456_c0~~gnl/MRDRNA2_/MRDRNA2_94456_c0_seq1.p1  ORF type:complete len:111 (+),score=10.09 gnl/MRDRNA2_/MRDRNA2_94456_c0_seq1:108-440(+)